MAAIASKVDDKQPDWARRSNLFVRLNYWRDQRHAIPGRYPGEPFLSSYGQAVEALMNEITRSAFRLFCTGYRQNWQARAGYPCSLTEAWQIPAPEQVAAWESEGGRWG